MHGASREDEPRVAKGLDLRAEQRRDFLLVLLDLLELVEDDDVRLACLAEEIEHPVDDVVGNLFVGYCIHLRVPQGAEIDTEFKPRFGADLLEAFRFPGGKIALPELGVERVDEVFRGVGVVQIDEDGVVFSFDGSVVQDVIQHAGFAQSSGGREDDIVSVLDVGYDLFGFLFAVTEVLIRDVGVQDKRIRNVFSSSHGVYYFLGKYMNFYENIIMRIS